VVLASRVKSRFRMKKTITTHRLQLTTETLRSLSSAELLLCPGKQVLAQCVLAAHETEDAGIGAQILQPVGLKESFKRSRIRIGSNA